MAILNTILPFAIITNAPDRFVQSHSAANPSPDFFTAKGRFAQEYNTTKWWISLATAARVIILLAGTSVQGIEIDTVLHGTLVDKLAVWNILEAIDKAVCKAQ